MDILTGTNWLMRSRNLTHPHHSRVGELGQQNLFPMLYQLMECGLIGRTGLNALQNVVVSLYVQTVKLALTCCTSTHT